MEDKKLLKYIDDNIERISKEIQEEKDNFASITLYNTDANTIYNIASDSGRVKALRMMKIFIEMKGGDK